MLLETLIHACGIRTPALVPEVQQQTPGLFDIKYLQDPILPQNLDVVKLPFLFFCNCSILQLEYIMIIICPSILSLRAYNSPDGEGLPLCNNVTNNRDMPSCCLLLSTLHKALEERHDIALRKHCRRQFITKPHGMWQKRFLVTQCG